MAAGAIIEIAVPDTIADGQQTTSAGQHTFPIIQQCVDEIVTVTDDQIVEAMVFLFKYQNQVVEPSGASSLAAVLNGKTRSTGKRAGVIISGGNISPERFFELSTK